MNLLDSGVDFIATDMPHADKFTVGIMALVAEKELEMISQRTKDGLAAAKRRGKKLGNPRPLHAVQLAVASNLERAKSLSQLIVPVIQEIQKAHVSTLRGMAHRLNVGGFKTPNGKAFFAQSVKNALLRGVGEKAVCE